MTYREQPRWAADLQWEQRPDAISHRDVAGVAVDAADQVPEDHAPHPVQKFTAPQAAPRAEG